MKRNNPLIYCRKCRANRVMKPLGGHQWECLQCEAQHAMEYDEKKQVFGKIVRLAPAAK